MNPKYDKDGGMNLTAAQVKDDLLKEFKIDGPLLDDFAKIGAFLADAGAVGSKASLGLRELNAAIGKVVWNGTPKTQALMCERLNKNYLTASEKEKTALFGQVQTELCKLLLLTKTTRANAEHADKVKIIQGDEATAFQGVLQAVLLKNEYAHGMHTDDQGHPLVPPLIYSFTGTIEVDKFLQAVKAGYQWKDIGVSPEHGVFSHRIQWYLISQADDFWHLKPQDFKNVYREIGKYTGKVADSLNQTSLWARLCDRPVTSKRAPSLGLDLGTSDGKDFRSPERVTLHIQNRQTELPWLYATVQKGQDKYQSVFGQKTPQQEYHTGKSLGNNPQFQEVDSGILRRK
jgi:hypothetical protein